MTSTTTDRRLGLNSGNAIKIACRAATTANIALTGEQTVDGVACVTGDRVLVKNQTLAYDNGIYVVDTGGWTRDKDFDSSFDVLQGTLIPVYNGASTYNIYALSNANPIVIGTTSLTFETVDSSAALAALANATDVAKGDALVGYTQTEDASHITSAEARTVHLKLREFVSLEDFLPKSALSAIFARTSTTDVGPYVNLALTRVGAWGSQIKIRAPRGTLLIGEALGIYDRIELEGQGRGATTFFLKAGANVDIFKKAASGAVGTRVALRHMTIDGNEANNTSGGIFWSGSTGQGEPSMTMEHVRVTGCRPTAGGAAGAIVLVGGDWSVLRDCQIYQNNYAYGLVVQSSDGFFAGVYISQNGGLASGKRNLLLSQSNSGRYVGCYFGGTTADNQVNIEGSQYNQFLSCVNDNAWFNGYHLTDSGGIASSYNTWTGGQCSNSGINANNTNDNFSFNGAATGNVVSGVVVRNTNANKARYGFSEGGTASGNLVIGCNVAAGAFASGVKIFNAAGGSRIVNSMGFNRSLPSAQGAAVTAANNLVLGTDGRYFQIAGATQINLLSSTDWDGGDTVTLKFNSTPTVKHNTAVSGVNKPILLAGGVDFVASANDTLSLRYDATDAVWYETARAVI